jgi:hypothetical protein
MPGVAFPPVGSVGDGSPPASVLCSAKTAIRPVSGRFARRSLPDTLRASARSCCPCWARGRVEALRPRQGLGSPGPPGRVCRPGDRWLSPVPELPLWRYAPLSDPGGVLRTCHSAPRTAAFRCVQTVGVPLDTPEGIFVTTTLLISGLDHAACLLTTPGSVHPLTMVHAGSFLTCWRGFDQVGLELVAFSPTG